MVNAFYEGSNLPKSISHINLVIFLEIDIVQSFSITSPISLSNFLNKGISRVVYGSMNDFLPILILKNHSWIVKGRNITKNMLLTQEIISDSRMREKSTNMMVKLNMTMSYDKLVDIFGLNARKIRFFYYFVVDKIESLFINN